MRNGNRKITNHVSSIRQETLRLKAAMASLWLKRPNIGVCPAHHNGNPFAADWLVGT
jgi:hypothetical protein